MTVAVSPHNTCSGTGTTSVGGGGVSLSGGSLPAGSRCIFFLDVTSSTPGDSVNTSGAIHTNEAGNGGTATATLNVVAPPSIAKAFGAAAIALNGTTSLTFTITNPSTNTVDLNGVAVTDILPTGLTVPVTGPIPACGGGTLTTPSSTTISLTGGSVAANGQCQFSVTVTGAASGSYTNTTGNVSSTNGGTGNTATANLTVATPPTIVKAFGAASIPVGGTSTITFKISNPNAFSLSGLTFNDGFPSGMTVAGMPNASNTCGGTFSPTANATSVGLSGGTVGSSGSCTLKVNVTDTSAGVQSNTTGALSSNEGGTGATSNTAMLTVVSPPGISKQFGALSIPLNGSTSLTFTVTNNNGTTDLTGVGFSDTLPADLVISTPNGESGTCLPGTITAIHGTNVISLSGATVTHGGGTCTFSVNVTGTAAGAKNNTTGSVTSTQGGTGATASASIAVVAPPSIAKAFGAASVVLNGTTSLTFTITNPAANTVAESGVAFTDTLTSGLEVATPNNGLSNNCGGTALATAGGNSISLTGGSITTPGTTCTVVVNVTGTAYGNYTNTSGPVSSTNGGTGNTASANLAVASPPAIAKVFGASSIPLNGTTPLTFTITNPSVNTISLTGVGFTDTLPGGLVVATPSGLSTTCSGTPTAVASSSSVSLSSATLTSHASCTLSVNVKGTSAGLQNNSVTVNSTTAGTGNTSNASITVVAPPTIAKAFLVSSIPLNGKTHLTFTIQNTNTTTALSGIGFSDTLPAGLVISTPKNLTGTVGGGTLTATQGTSVITLSGASLAANGTLSFGVDVTGTTAGAKNNTTGVITSTQGGTGSTASASLAVVAPPTISKAFRAATILPGGTTTLTFTLTNPSVDTVAENGVAFSDTLTGGLQVASTPGMTNGCGGTFNGAISGSTSLSLSGGSIPINSSCTISLNITGTSNGTKTNITGPVSSTNGGTGTTSNTATLTIDQPPYITSANNTTFIKGMANSFTVTTTGFPVPALSYSPIGSLPAGVTFHDNGNGTATISGKPTVSGTFSFWITASNGVSPQAQQSFSLTVH